MIGLSTMSCIWYLALSVQTLVFSHQFETMATSIEIDDLGNVYLIHSDKIEKVNGLGDSMSTYSDLRLVGEVQFDVGRALKPLVFYPDIGRFSILDNTLSPHVEHADVFGLPYGQITAMANSTNASYWIFDQTSFELIRLDQGMQEIVNTGNLATMLNRELNPAKILEQKDKVFLYDKAQGVFMFDIYGTYHSRLDVRNSNDMQLKGDMIYFFLDETIEMYHMRSKLWESVALPEKSAQRVRVGNENVYLLTSGYVRVYQAAKQ
jgi:hypothetical protein